MEIEGKKHPTIGCCGIDCGLCPRFYTKGDSVCPGCCGLNFEDKHPACGLASCCTKKKELEVCSNCNDYPCKKFIPVREGYDSFVTHKKIISNLDFIKNIGIESFIEQQHKRIEILTSFLTDCDDGRSKCFFCLSCALLPLEKLEDVFTQIHENYNFLTVKEKNKILKESLLTIADELKIELKLITK